MTNSINNHNKQGTPPPQIQDRQPGLESNMHPQPEYLRADYKGSQKLEHKVAIITGGDSGIGRAVSLHFAIEGAKIVIVYLDEHDDANKTRHLIEEAGGGCLLLAGDISKQDFSR